MLAALEEDFRRMTAAEIIEFLQLKPHPQEGGFYRETYRSSENFSVLPPRYTAAAGGETATGKTALDKTTGSRCFSTAIYYLVTGEHCSLLHKLCSDEVYHFYLGSAVTLLMLHPNGEGERRYLGNNVSGGEQPQAVVPRGVWQGLCIEKGDKDSFALLGTTVAPGFEFEDNEVAERAALVAKYSQFAELICKLTV